MTSNNVSRHKGKHNISHNNNNNDIEKDRSFRTVTASQTPKEMRPPAIINGYRLTNQPWSYYIKSLFHLHNETWNIWTHLIGFILVICQTWYYFNIYRSHDSPIQWTVIVFGTCCCTTLINSTIAHWLHSKSRYVNYVIFMFDYIGVIFWGYGTSVLAQYGVSTKEMYNLIGPNYMLFHLVFAYLNFLNMCNSKLMFGHDLGNNRRKPLMISGILIEAIFACIPWFPRYITCYESEECNLASLNHISVVLISFVLMAVSFVLHQPERTCPGKFDIFGQSHQIFHVFVIITQSLQLRCLYVDFVSGVNVHCKPDIYTEVLYIVILYSLCLITIVALRPRVRRSLENNKKRT